MRRTKRSNERKKTATTHNNDDNCRLPFINNEIISPNKNLNKSID